MKIIEEKINDAISKLGENIKLRRYLKNRQNKSCVWILS